MTLGERFRRLHASGKLDLPLPAAGSTAARHRGLLEIAREDLALARLAEAHVDAVAILAEASRAAVSGALYGVWASEIEGQPLALECHNGQLTLVGSKMFCTGAGLVDRALITVTAPEQRLIDVDLRVKPETVTFDMSAWKTSAFAETQTATATFLKMPVAADAVVGGTGWYLKRPGFWHGACGPAACWAGGAIQLVDYALAQKRNDAHTLAHLGAMAAQAWALRAYLDTAGNEIDTHGSHDDAALRRALTVRHLVEECCSDILRRLGRAYGPRALAFDRKVLGCYQELELYIRQSHAERDLEALGRELQR